MAIEIIPKRTIRKISSLDIFFYFILILFLALLISYFVLGFYEKRMNNELTLIKKSIEKTEEEKNLEKEIFGSENEIGYQQRIKDFNNLFYAHKLPLNIFNFLEENTHPEIWFSSFNLDIEKNLLIIDGSANNFETLGQQSVIFKQQDFIKNINLSKISLGKEGEINFEFQLALDPKIFK